MYTSYILLKRSTTDDAERLRAASIYIGWNKNSPQTFRGAAIQANVIIAQGMVSCQFNRYPMMIRRGAMDSSDFRYRECQSDLLAMGDFEILPAWKNRPEGVFTDKGLGPRFDWGDQSNDSVQRVGVGVAKVDMKPISIESHAQVELGAGADSNRVFNDLFSILGSSANKAFALGPGHHHPKGNHLKGAGFDSVADAVGYQAEIGWSVQQRFATDRFAPGMIDDYKIQMVNRRVKVVSFLTYGAAQHDR